MEWTIEKIRQLTVKISRLSAREKKDSNKLIILEGNVEKMEEAARDGDVEKWLTIARGEAEWFRLYLKIDPIDLGWGLFRVFHSDGKLWEIGNFENGKPHGAFVKYTYSDRPSSEGFYKEGKLHGKLTVFHLNGIIHEQSFWENGQPHGEKTSYHEVTGKMVEKMNFHHGSRHGEYRAWYPDGELAHTEFFQNGKRQGERTIYYKNGQVAEKSFFDDDERHGECLRFYENGQPWAKINFKRGRLHGDYHLFFNNRDMSENRFNGNIMEWSHYKEGRLWSEHINFSHEDYAHINADNFAPHRPLPGEQE